MRGPIFGSTQTTQLSSLRAQARASHTGRISGIAGADRVGIAIRMTGVLAHFNGAGQTDPTGRSSVYLRCTLSRLFYAVAERMVGYATASGFPRRRKYDESDSSARALLSVRYDHSGLQRRRARRSRNWHDDAAQRQARPCDARPCDILLCSVHGCSTHQDAAARLRDEVR